MVGEESRASLDTIIICISIQMRIHDARIIVHCQCIRTTHRRYRSLSRLPTLSQSFSHELQKRNLFSKRKWECLGNCFTALSVLVTKDIHTGTKSNNSHCSKAILLTVIDV